MKYDPLILLSIGGLVVVIAVLSVLAVKFRVKLRNKAAANKLAYNLRDEKLKSSIILEAIDDGVVLIDDQQTIQLFNPGASKITGWNSEEARGLSWQSVFVFTNSKDEAITDSEDPFSRSLITGKTIRDNTINIKSKSNKTIAVSFTVSPLMSEQKQVTGAVGIFRDVSQERQEEAQRAEFISTASHEMRTPVAAIEGYLALALNDKVSAIDSRARDYLEKAHASTQHLGKLFQDLLTSAKAEDGRLTSHPEVIEMGAYLRQLVQDLKFSAEKKGLSMEFILGSSTSIDASSTSLTSKGINPLLFAYADPDRLREVITNLFDNAVKYTDQGKVTVGLTGNDKIVQLYIRDTGHGIPPEDVPHLFQKFYRVDNSATRSIGGTGLGLFISRKIIELYQGRIWVESQVDKGSTFFINLPRLDSQKADEMKSKNPSDTILKPINSLSAPS